MLLSLTKCKKSKNIKLEVQDDKRFFKKTFHFLQKSSCKGQKQPENTSFTRAPCFPHTNQRESPVTCRASQPLTASLLRAAVVEQITRADLPQTSVSSEARISERASTRGGGEAAGDLRRAQVG